MPGWRRPCLLHESQPPPCSILSPRLRGSAQSRGNLRPSSRITPVRLQVCAELILLDLLTLLSPRLSWYVDLSSCEHRATSNESMIRSYKGVTPQFPDTCYVDDSAQLIGHVILGEHSSIWMNAVLRGDVHQIRVGHYSNIQNNCVLHGMKEQYGVHVGDYVTVGHAAILHGCTIEARCLIGMGGIILHGAVIGS